MHFVGVALLCIALGAAGSYLMSRSDKQIDPPLPEIAPSVLKKGSGPDACRCQGCGCKGGPGWRDAKRCTAFLRARRWRRKPDRVPMSAACLSPMAMLGAALDIGRSR